MVTNINSNPNQFARVKLLKSFPASTNAPSPEISGVRILGKSAKVAVHSLERGIALMFTGGFLIISGELGILMCGFTFSWLSVCALSLCFDWFASGVSSSNLSS